MSLLCIWLLIQLYFAQSKVWIVLWKLLSTHLFFLFILEFERRLYRTSFVKESSPHVDFVHQTQIEANEIQRGIKYTVGNKLGQDLALLQIVLKPAESKR